jgi:hypothetical protein
VESGLVPPVSSPPYRAHVLFPMVLASRPTTPSRSGLSPPFLLSSLRHPHFLAQLVSSIIPSSRLFSYTEARSAISTGKSCLQPSLPPIGFRLRAEPSSSTFDFLRYGESSLISFALTPSPEAVLFSWLGLERHFPREEGAARLVRFGDELVAESLQYRNSRTLISRLPFRYPNGLTRAYSLFR